MSRKIRRTSCLAWLAMVCLVGTVLAQGQSPQFGPRLDSRPQGYGPPAVPYQAPSPRPTEGSPLEIPPGSIVSGVGIKGNVNVSESQIYRHIRTRKDRVYDAQTVKEDVRRLYATRLFHNVRTFTQPGNGGVFITYEVFERPTIGEVKFIGNRRLSDRSLLKNSGLSTGESLNVFAVQEAKRKIEELYDSKGMPETTVEVLEGDRPKDRRIVLMINEDKLKRIWDVKFEGNDPSLATDGRLKTQIKSKPGFFKYLLRGKISSETIDADVERLTAYYRNLGYFQARVGRELEYGPSGEWATIRFVVDEGVRYRVRNISVVGSDRLNQEGVQEKMKLVAGEYFNLTAMQHDESFLRDLYGSQGYIFADIKSNIQFDEDPGTLDIVFKVDEGDQFRVGKINIHIAGDFPHTKESVILNRLSLRPGDVIDIREVRASERRIKSSQLFENNPANGNPPRIEIRPPDVGEELASQVAGPNYRGQSPDGHNTRYMVLDLHLPPVKQETAR